MASIVGRRPTRPSIRNENKENAFQVSLFGDDESSPSPLPEIKRQKTESILEDNYRQPTKTVVEPPTDNDGNIINNKGENLYFIKKPGEPLEKVNISNYKMNPIYYGPKMEIGQMYKIDNGEVVYYKPSFYPSFKKTTAGRRSKKQKKSRKTKRRPKKN
jgi:hypothetical protein